MGGQYRDRWCPPLEVTSNINIIITEASVGLHVVSIPVGTYYAHRDSNAYMEANWPGLYKEIEDQINAAIAGTVEIVAVPDPQNPGAGPVMIAIQRVGGNAIQLDLSNGGFSFTREWLGFAEDDTTDATEINGVIYGRRRPAGVWTSYGHAWRRRPRVHRLRQLSTEDVWRADADVVEHGQHVERAWRYAQTPAADIFSGYALREDYARAAQRRLGDDHGVFEEVFDALQRLDDVLVIMSAVLPTGSDLLATSHPWEVCRLMGDVQSLDPVVADSPYSSEHHTFTYRTARIDANEEADAP